MTTILSLFDYTGNWSSPYREHGYNVVQVDIKHGQDIMTWDYRYLHDVHGILAAVPCTDFAASGARWFAEKDTDGRTAKSIALVKKTLEIIDFFQPAWWAIENPVGRMNTLVPEMAQHGPWYFQPCDYGEPYTKKTGLWGNFTPPLPIFVGQAWKPVEPTEGSKMHLLPPSPERAALRSVTPLGFSRAFFIANP
jgi:hypothetical protein